MNPLSDKELVGLCLEELCAKIGYSDRTKLSQSDFEHLCYLVEEKTKIIISVSTIKRVFNGNFERLPQSYTLDALTKYIGYSGWQEFKATKLNSAKNSPSPAHESGEISKDHTKAKESRAYRYSALAGVTIILVAVAFISIRKNAGTEASFSVQKIVSEGVPANVIFNYDIDHVEGDSFYIQPSWNKTLRIKIAKNRHTQTETYYEPGYHTAKLIGDDKILKQVRVHIPTKGWIGYTKVNFSDPYPQYFQAATIVRDSVLGLNLSGLKANDIEIRNDKIYYYACFPDSLNIDSDNFTLIARIRMDPVKPTLCPWIISEVYSQNSLFFFTGTTPGCTGEVHAMFSDRYLDGKKNDLSSLGFDVRSWKDVRIAVKNRVVKISIEEKEVFTTTYERPGGLIQGMGFGSNGLCEVDFVQLTDSIGNIVYHNDFKSLN